MTAAWALILFVGMSGSLAATTTYFTTLDMCNAAKGRMTTLLLAVPASVQGECVLVGPGLKGDEGIPAFSALKQGR